MKQRKTNEVVCHAMGSLPDFKPWRTRYETKLYQIPKFSLNGPKSKQDTAIWKCQNLQRNVCPSGRCVRMPLRMPYTSLLIVTFFNRCISVKTSMNNTKLGNLVNLGLLFLTMWIKVANPIIYRLVPSPSRFEIRQYGHTWTCNLRADWKDSGHRSPQPLT